MTRSNKDRVQAPPQPSIPADSVPEQASPMHFVVPTEVVDLPSKGRFYGADSPLHNCASIEIRHMTAKEEDILTSTTLLKKGLALDKMIQSVIVDKNIKVEDLLLGDKNSLLVHSRIFGYGADYTTTITCGTCDHQFDHTFDLNNLEVKPFEEAIASAGIEVTENSTFIMELPKSKYNVEFRLLTSGDESKIFGKTRDLRTLQLLEGVVISINGQTDTFYKKRALTSLPILDASILKRVYNKISPDIDLTQEVTCSNCAESTQMGVPLDANFFWPDV